MPHPQTNVRLDPDLKAAATAAANDRGITLSELLALALRAYLGSPSTGPDTIPTSGPDTGPDTLARVEAVEAKIASLEAKVDAMASLSNAATGSTPASLSDAALRKRHKQAGSPGPGFIPWAQGQGWERTGKGNRAQWRRAGE